VSEFDPAEQAVLKLRLEAGLEPAEVRERLGLTERQYRRVAERAGKALMDEFRAFDRGDWARRKRSLLCACVMGIASARQHERARQLLAEDPCCRAMMSELRRLGDNVTSILPWPAAAVATASEHTRVAEHLADLGTAVKDRAADLVHHAPYRGGADDGRPRLTDKLAGVRRPSGELATTVKHHATSAYLRVADPTPLSGARPGAVGAVIASCVAVGGGVSYCVTQGIDPLGSLARVGIAKKHEPAPKREPDPAPQGPPHPALGTCATPARHGPLPPSAPCATAPSAGHPTATGPAAFPASGQLGQRVRPRRRADATAHPPHRSEAARQPGPGRRRGVLRTMTTRRYADMRRTAGPAAIAWAIRGCSRRSASTGRRRPSCRAGRPLGMGGRRSRWPPMCG